MAIQDKVNGTFTYYPIPKNASTSIKRWIYAYFKAHEPRFASRYDKRNRIPVHEVFPSPKANGGSITLTQRRSFKFAIVRDPATRFISAYKNRVLFHHTLYKDREQLESIKLPLEPGINEFIANFKIYTKISSEIRHHCMAQQQFIGKIIHRLDQVYDVSEINAIEEQLKTLTNFKLPLEHAQSGGKDYQISKLSTASCDFLWETTQSDYDMLNSLWPGRYQFPF